MLFSALEKNHPVQHDDAAAGQAFDLNVRARPNDEPFVAAAWMRFSRADAIAQANLIFHKEPPFFLTYGNHYIRNAFVFQL